MGQPEIPMSCPPLTRDSTHLWAGQEMTRKRGDLGMCGRCGEYGHNARGHDRIGAPTTARTCWVPRCQSADLKAHGLCGYHYGAAIRLGAPPKAVRTHFEPQPRTCPVCSVAMSDAVSARDVGRMCKSCARSRLVSRDPFGMFVNRITRSSKEGPVLRPIRACVGCGSWFVARSRKGSTTCGVKCRSEVAARLRPKVLPRPPVTSECQHCGMPFTQRRVGHKYHRKCRGAAEKMNRQSRDRVSGKKLRGAVRYGGVIYRAQVLERDGWTCYLCGQEIRRGVAFPDPMSPSIDHVVPISRGGVHTMDNVRATHLICNSRKRDLDAPAA